MGYGVWEMRNGEWSMGYDVWGMGNGPGVRYGTQDFRPRGRGGVSGAEHRKL